MTPTRPERALLSPWVLVLLGGLALLLVAPALLGDRVFGYGDWLTYYLPLRDRLVVGWRSGSLLPWWWPAVLDGYPAGANPQYGLFYPPHLLLLLFPLGNGLALLTGLHLALGGAGMAVLLRGRGISPVPAVLGGVVYLAAGPALAASTSVTPTLALAWLPWVLHFFPAGLEAEARGARRAAAVALALMLLGGGLEVLLWCVLLLPFWCVASWRVYLGSIPGLAPPPPARRRWGPVVPGLVVVGGTALLLSGIQLLPFLDLVVHSTRSLAADPAAARFLPFAGRWSALLLPRAGWDPATLTSWIDLTGQVRAHYLPVLFFGLTVLVLAAHGWRESPRAERNVLAVAGGLAALFALGSGWPMVDALERLVPGSFLYRYPEKYFLLLVPLLAWLSAWGLEWLTRTRGAALPGEHDPGPRGGLLFAAGLAGLAAALLIRFVPAVAPALLHLQGLSGEAGATAMATYRSAQVFDLAVGGLIALASGLLLGRSRLPDQSWRPGPSRPGWSPAFGGALIVVLVAVELFGAGRSFFSATSLAGLREPSPAARALLARDPAGRTLRWTSLQQERAPRALMRDQEQQRRLYHDWLEPNLLALQGVSAFDGLGAFRLKEQAAAEEAWRALPGIGERVRRAGELDAHFLLVTDPEVALALERAGLPLVHPAAPAGGPSDTIPMPPLFVFEVPKTPAVGAIPERGEPAVSAAAPRSLPASLPVGGLLTLIGVLILGGSSWKGRAPGLRRR